MSPVDSDYGSMDITVHQSALTFHDSTSEGVYLPVEGSLDIAAAGKVTVSAWVNPHTPPDAGYIFTKSTSSADGYRLYLQADRTVRAIGNGGTSFATTDTLPNNEWSHTAVTWDNTTCNIYINGVNKKSGTNDAIGNSAGSGAIGCRHDSSGNPYLPHSGQITNVIVWSGVALTDDQVMQVFHGVLPETANIAGEWRCNDGDGTTLTDYSVHGIDGYIYGPIDWSSRDLRCWATRWDEDNWGVTIETFMNAEDRNFLFQHVTPGAVRELYNILGTPYFIDTTYTSSNTLTFTPVSTRGLNNVRQTREVAIKAISDTFLNNEIYSIKIEGRRIDI